MDESEPGTVVYVVHREAATPDVRIFYELYRDEAAFEDHERMPHVRRFLTERAQYLAAEPEVWRLTPTVGIVRQDLDSNGG